MVAVLVVVALAVAVVVTVVVVVVAVAVVVELLFWHRTDMNVFIGVSCRGAEGTMWM